VTGCEVNDCVSYLGKEVRIFIFTSAFLKVVDPSWCWGWIKAVVAWT